MINSQDEVKFQVAFLPTNSRLIQISKSLSSELSEIGISSCILKTSLLGENLSGWNIENKENYPIQEIDALSYKEDSNFFKTTLRTIESTKKLLSEWEPNFNVLITFMDDYCEGEILTNVCNKLGVSTIYFQEGFQHRDKQYSLSFYDFIVRLRSLIFKKYFPGKSMGLLSKKVFLWSEYGYKDKLTSLGKSEKDIKVVGYPFKPMGIKVMPHSSQLQVLIAHQPLYPRYASKSWGKKMWVNLVSALLDMDLKVYLKFHPRKTLEEEKSEILKNIKSTNIKKLEIVDKAILAEDALEKVHVMVTTLSAASLNALHSGIPVIFIKTKYNQIKLLEAMSLKEEAIFIDLKELPSKISALKKRDNWKKWSKKGRRTLEKLGGLNDDFLFNFSTNIKQTLKESD